MVKISVGKAEASCINKVTLTSGMVNAVQVTFNFSPEWEGLDKIAVFSNGNTSIDISLEEDMCHIPHEILAEAGKEVTCGVYGSTGEGADYVALPTVMCYLGTVKNGTDPSGEESAEPTPSVLVDHENRISELEKGSGGGTTVKEASVSVEHTSLVGITTSDDEAVEITDNKLTCGVSTTFFIDVHGEIDFEFASSSPEMIFYVDDKKMGYFDGSTMSYVGETSYKGYVERGITFKLVSFTTITVTKFDSQKFSGGILSSELAEKVITTKVFTEAEKQKLADTEVFTEEEKTELERVSAIGDVGYTYNKTYLDNLFNEGKLTVNEGAVVERRKITNVTKAVFTPKCHVDINLRAERSKVYINGKLYKDLLSASITHFTYTGFLDTMVIEFNDAGNIQCDHVGGTKEHFGVAEYTNGYMTGEHLKKLDNTPTTAEVENLINGAFGIVEAVFDEVHEYAESLGGDEA